MRRSALFALLLAALSAAPAASQSTDGAFADDGARELVEAALAPGGDVGGPAAAGVTGRARVRVRIPGQWNWRVRTLLHKEAAGRVRYGPTGDTVEDTVLLRERSAPLIGRNLVDRRPLWGVVGFDPEVSDPPLLGLLGLSLGTVVPDVPAASEAGVVRLFDTTFVDPLGPLGTDTYRYESGADLRTEEPDGRLLRQVRFRPRGDASASLDGIVWFDAATGEPVRAMIRPRGGLRVNTSLLGLAARIPLIPKGAGGHMDYLEIQYGPGRDGGYRPTLLRVDGIIRSFWNQFLMPLQAEWALDWDAPPDAEAAAPPPFPSSWAVSDENRALRPFIRQLDAMAGRPPAPGLGALVSGTLSSVRFNQVQGINFQVSYPIPVGARTSLEPRLNIPTSSFQWTGSLGLRQERYPLRYGVEGYSRLRDADAREQVNGALASVTALVTGYDDGNYYLARGARVWLRYGELPASGFLSLFAERHEGAARRVDYSLLEPDTSRVLPDLPVDTGTYVGVRAHGQLQLGEDPQEGVILLRLFSQAAVGERDFVTVGTTSDMVTPLPGPFTGALRLQAGISGGDVPGQGRFYLGGVRTIRGYPVAVTSGSSTFIATGELGTQVPLVRLVAFGEVGWANDATRLFDDEALVTVGGGLSVGDGILRIDMARGLSSGGVWRLHFATSGLF